MLYSPYTKLDRKAFVFSMDSGVAVLLLIGVVYILLAIPFPEEGLGSLQTVQLVDDSFALLHSTGYLLRTVDSNAPTDAVQNIYTRSSSLLPNNLSLRVDLKQYTVDMGDCRLNKTFEECFLENEVITVSAGAALPSDKDVFHGRKILMKKQPPGDCNLSYLLLSGSEKASQTKKDFELLFADYQGPIFLQEDGDLNVTFDVSVDPSDQISCDENVAVTLTVSVNEEIRKPIDIMLVMDRSGSMSECAIANGTVIHQSSGSLGGGTRVCVLWWWFWCLLWEYQDWQYLADFDITNNDAFDVFLEWVGGDDGTQLPKMYIEAPDGTTYGFYGGTPDDGCYVSSENNIYIAVPTTTSQNGTWRVYAWNDDPAVDYDLTVKIIDAPISKLDAMKQAGKDFIDNAEWTTDDYTGLTSFATTAKTDQPLTSNRIAVKNSIDTLKAGGATAIGEGIYEATEELLPPPSGHGREEALSFQVLLSDGYTNTGRDSEDAAYDARDKNITIFTIGFGTSIDEDELRTIAEITGGEYYYAGDADALQEIYDIIAGRIQEMASDTNVVVPVLLGSYVVELGGGTVVDGNIVFEIGTIEAGVPWVGTYILNFPCNNYANCEVEAITFPGEGAYFTYTDSEGVVHTIDFNASTTVDFLIRDIRVDIYSGELVGENDIYLDVNVFNFGDLNTGETTLNFRLGDLDGTLLASRDVPELCGIENPECVSYFKIYSSVSIENEGVIYAIVNDDNALSECPIGNYDAVNCYGGPSIQYFVLDYYVWRD